MGSGGGDLLIFSQRGIPSPGTDAGAQSKKEEEPVQQAPPEERTMSEIPKPKGKEESGKPDISKMFCTNHPWRSAFAICAKCKRPFCYVDIMEHNGKSYCLQDIDTTTDRESEEAGETAINHFSILASMFLFANSIILGYFTYPQTAYLASSITQQGVTNFFTNINPLYYLPMANILVVIFSVVAALMIFSRSTILFGFSLMITLGSLFVIAYEYLLSNILVYTLASSVLLLLAIALMTYSRMSSLAQRSDEKFTTQTIRWPKPETF